MKTKGYVPSFRIFYNPAVGVQQVAPMFF